MGRIQLDNVTKHYDDGDIVAVDGLSVDVEDGEFLVLVGPSGCGKSTTLRMIAGLETPTEGTIRIGDRVVNGLQPRERDIAMVFQNYALYPHMTVRENMGFGLKLSTDLDEDEIDARVREAAEMMDIAELLDQKPKQLSGGQQQRAALGRAIVRDPAAFLFDEPLSNLDAKLRAQMRTEITRLQHDLEVTSVYVTHDQAEAMTMGDRIAVMNDGQLQQLGTPNEVYDHPANRFVADFIGEPSMNFLAVELQQQGGEYVLVAHEEPEFGYPLDDDLVERLDAGDGDRLTLGVRPEDANLVYDGDGTDDRVQTASIDVVEEMGSDDFVYVDVGPETWTVRSEERIKLDQDRTVDYTFDPADIYLFDENDETIKSKGLDGDAVATTDADATTRSVS